MNDTDKIAVVKPYYVTEEAYKMGYDRFEGMGPFDPDDPEAFELSHFKESATWANTVAPSLRAMAGFADSKVGTYQVNRDVASIDDGAEEDEPAEATLMPASRVYDRLVSAWDQGAHDAAYGRERDVSRLE